MKNYIPLLLCSIVAPSHIAHAATPRLEINEAPVAAATRLRVFASRAEPWKATLAELEWVETAGVTLESSDSQIYDGDGELLVVGRDGQRFALSITPSFERNQAALVQTLRGLRAWKFWGDPANSNGVLARAIAVEIVPVEVQIKDNSARVPIRNLPPVIHDGRFMLRNDGNFRVMARNTSAQTLYVALVYFALSRSMAASL